MADKKQDQEQQQEQEQGQESTGSASQSGGIATGTAAKAVAAAAATGAAALAARKVMSGRGESSNGNSNGGSPKEQGDEGEGSILSSVLSGGWEAARDALLPAAEDAAGAAGEYVAQHGPDVLRDRIVPRFVDSFNEARGGS
jgi:hypothetical protein